MKRIQVPKHPAGEKEGRSHERTPTRDTGRQVRRETQTESDGCGEEEGLGG